jgi:ABC-2 type transport system permease protein
MRLGIVATIFEKEWREIRVNRALLAAVILPAILFAAFPVGIVALLEYADIDPMELGFIDQFMGAFPPGTDPRVAAQAFIVVNFTAYLLLIPIMVPMALAVQSVVGEKQARSLEPQLAAPIAVPELLLGKALAAVLPAVVATWCVYVAYGLINGAIAGAALMRLVFSPQWLVAMVTLVPLICLFSVLFGIVVSARVNDPRTAQQIGSLMVVPLIGIVMFQFFTGQATFTLHQVLIGNLLFAASIGVMMVIGTWMFDRETILSRLG